GGKCQCPCGGGMASVVETDVLVTATMSNWGAFGVEAMLAFLLKQPGLVQTPALAHRVHYACLDAGGLEAQHCTRLFLVDGCDGETSISVVQMLGDLVRSALATPETGPAH